MFSTLCKHNNVLGCEQFTYGLECKQACGYCSKGEQCNHVNGSCLNGCDVGVYDDKCDKGKFYNLITICGFYEMIFFIQIREVFSNQRNSTHIKHLRDVKVKN